jgi:anti-sigma regulatory factor (Ser/Thr protein kinase)
MNFHLRLVMPSDPRFLPVVRAVVSELGLVYGLPEEPCLGVTLAVDEALANIIRHAYKHRHDQEIELKCQISGDQMEFRLLDRGEPPDPARICSQPLDDVSLSGRGTHLIKATMDAISYERLPEGNQLKLIKHLPASELCIDSERSAPHPAKDL